MTISIFSHFGHSSHSTNKQMHFDNKRIANMNTLLPNASVQDIDHLYYMLWCSSLLTLSLIIMSRRTCTVFFLQHTTSIILTNLYTIWFFWLPAACTWFLLTWCICYAWCLIAKYLSTLRLFLLTPRSNNKFTWCSWIAPCWFVVSTPILICSWEWWCKMCMLCYYLMIISIMMWFVHQYLE